MHDSDWKARHRAKLLTAEQAIKKISRGRRILVGSGAAEPAGLVNALVEHGGHLADNEIVHLLTLGPAPYTRPDLAARFRHSAFFIGANVREAVQEGRADFVPVFLSEIPGLIRSRRTRIDVVLIQVSPPDTRGYVSLGISVDIVRAAVDTADLVLAEVNPAMPRTHGDSFVRVDDIDGLVSVETPILELLPEPLDDVSLAIGKHVARLVPDGATLQTGIGKIPHAVMAALAAHHDLGIHTEMLSDSVMDLVESGVITGKKKTLLPGKLVTSFVMGSRRLYDWVDDNPAVELRPSDFTNDPFIIARNERMIAINSAFAVDLTGQVAADTRNGQFYSGIGGQVDFIRGAARSRGGKPIIALPSTASRGSLSRIQAGLEAGAGVVTSRGDVHWVVTEYGIADLCGKSIRERSMALIQIAHPDFRSDLLSGAKARKYVFADQRVPRVLPLGQETIVEKLRSGALVATRPLQMADETALQALLYHLSDNSAYQRFFSAHHAHAHEEMLEAVDVESAHSVALVATIEGEGGEELMVASARYDVDPATRLAEVSLVVSDAWQGKGVGSLLFRRLAKIGQAHGVSGFSADVLLGNGRMLALFSNSGLRLESELEQGVYRVRMTFP